LRVSDKAVISSGGAPRAVRFIQNRSLRSVLFRSVLFCVAFARPSALCPARSVYIDLSGNAEIIKWPRVAEQDRSCCRAK
jgi:hypothetical protein